MALFIRYFSEFDSVEQKGNLGQNFSNFAESFS